MEVFIFTYFDDFIIATAMGTTITGKKRSFVCFPLEKTTDHSHEIMKLDLDVMKDLKLNLVVLFHYLL